VDVAFTRVGVNVQRAGGVSLVRRMLQQLLVKLTRVDTGAVLNSGDLRCDQLRVKPETSGKSISTG